jgi:hypothetical protein
MFCSHIRTSHVTERLDDVTDLKMAPPVDLSSMSFRLTFNTCFESIVYRSQAFRVLLSRSVMAVCRFRPLGGGDRPEVASPFDSSTSVCCLCFITYHLI